MDICNSNTLPVGQSSSGSSSITSNPLACRLSNGDAADRVPSISPPAGESVRLISNSNTPTKSILKKPKQQQQQRREDQSSQSSKDERFSESSNVSFSDRDTPPGTNGCANGLGVARLDEEEKETPVDDLDDGDEVKTAPPDYSPSNTYLETSFEAGQGEASNKVGPPTLPKPRQLQKGRPQ